MIGFMNLQLEEFLSKNKMQMAFSKKTKTSIIQKHVRISLKKQNVDGILQKRQKKKKSGYRK